jgi:hypothetical protein
MEALILSWDSYRIYKRYLFIQSVFQQLSFLLPESMKQLPDFRTLRASTWEKGSKKFEIF